MADSVASAAPDTPVVEDKAAEPVEDGKTYYAWAPIQYGAKLDDDGSGRIIERLTIPVGGVVDQKKFKFTDEQWKELLTSRVIRRSKYPKVGRYQSPKRTLISEAARKMEAALAGDE